MNIIELKQAISKLETGDGPIYSVLIITNGTESYPGAAFSLQTAKRSYELQVKQVSLRDLTAAGCELLECDLAVVALHPDIDFGNIRNSADRSDADLIISQYKAMLDGAKRNLKILRLGVYVAPCGFMFSSESVSSNVYDHITYSVTSWLERYVAEHTVPSIVLSSNGIIAKLGLDKALDLNGYYRSQSVYKVDTWLEIAARTLDVFDSEVGVVRKVLCLDCDNTLWGGVVGELGPHGVKMTVNQGVYDIYTDIQLMFKSLISRGILLALVTKNELDDVLSVMTQNKNFQFDRSDFVAIKAGWGPKVDSISALSKELNLSLSSFVFVDDSDLECELVTELLPEVEVWQVPKRLSDYPFMAKTVCRRFERARILETDKVKLAAYQAESARPKLVEGGEALSGVLASLKLKAYVRFDSAGDVDRCHQLFQKTNQFNLNVTRFSRDDVHFFENETDQLLIAIDLEDKFGPYGVIFAGAFSCDGERMIIQNIVMSCRALGRGMEELIFEVIAYAAKRFRMTTVKGAFKYGGRNQQVLELLQSKELISTDIQFDDTASTSEFEFDATRFLGNVNHNIEVIWCE